MSDITKKFHSSSTVFNVILKMKTERKQPLNKHQNTSDLETNKHDATDHEQVTDHDARKFTAGL
jgi:hypothetical protein